MQGGRAKAYRPLPLGQRQAALTAFMAAYDRGDAFLAHELLEPAWMGTADPAERDLYQGLIKLAAAEVHAVRGNPLGEAKNLRGARMRLGEAVRSDVLAGPAAGPAAELDLVGLLTGIDARLAALVEATIPSIRPDGPTIPLARSGGGAGPEPRSDPAR